ncbi:MAG: anaerobic nitric oxide reductase flavorubredoxin [Peptococcia bacterium]
MERKITEKVTWVGKIDWELRKFHGDEYSTHRGSSYNSYLIRDKKNVLIDTVWKPYDTEFVAQLKQNIDLHEIDYIILNHGEVDHSGALPELMREIPDTPIYCTANGVKSIKGQYHQDWNFVTVKTGDTLDIGDSTLTFIEAPMLHWPDTMFTYMSGENILFSNDGFGQHYASESLYNDTVDKFELETEALKYYANILTPFSSQVTKKINEILSLNLPLSMICPSHGVIWKDNPTQIIERYLQWADNYAENQITIVYDTMWNGTRRMAEAIAEGIGIAAPELTVKLYNSSRTDKTDIITEVFRSRAVLIGSPTVNNGLLYSIAGILELMRGLKMKNKAAAAFGSYGWSGESVILINELLSKAGFELIDEGFRTMWTPDEETLLKLREYGKEFYTKLKDK